MKTKLYVLRDENWLIRYVGKTVKPLRDRMYSHIYSAKSGENTHKSRWIRSMQARGFLPNIALIREVDGDGCQEEKDQIKFLREKGIDLVNTTIGGDGVMSGRKMSEESRRKMSLARKGKRHSSKWNKKVGIANKGKVRSQEMRKKLSLANLGKRHSEATKEKMRIVQSNRAERRRNRTTSLKGKKLSAEHRKNISIGRINGKHRSAEERAKMNQEKKNVPLSKEHCKRISEASKKSWRNQYSLKREGDAI